jgi:hypothetical protein
LGPRGPALLLVDGAPEVGVVGVTLTVVGWWSRVERLPGSGLVPVGVVLVPEGWLGFLAGFRICAGGW